MKIYFWDLASSATFTWISFNDVDYTPMERPCQGIIIGRRPRHILNLEASFKERPTIIR